MVALHSFGVAVHRELGREQFLAFYMTTAVASSLTSHVTTVVPLLSGVAARTVMRMGRCALSGRPAAPRSAALLARPSLLGGTPTFTRGA